MKQKVLSVIVLLALCLGILPGMAGAASTPAVYSKMSASYKNGPYYDKLMSVKLTGNQITDLIAVAASQLGYHESNSKSELSGTASSSCSGNCTEYGNRTGTNGEPWCASFVSWCFREAGIPTSIMPTSGGVGTLRNSVYNNGATWHSVDSGYKPKTGDLVLYESMGGKYKYYQYASRDKNGVPSSSSHVGIVVSDFDSKTQTYCTIEGNGNQGSVKYLSKQKLYMAGPTKDGGTMNRIQGFVTPAYTTGTGSGYDGNQVDNSLTVSLTTPTDPAYTSKQSVSDTNATVVTCITKTPGSSITQSGLILSQADGTLIKKHTETVTNVSKSTATFHAWYDIRKELGVTLTPGTTYKYQFFAVVNNKTFLGNTYTFRTTGSAPSYTVTFDPCGGSVSPSTMAVRTGDVYGSLPIPQREGYTFAGWFTAASGGSQVSANTNVSAGGDQVLYAHWSSEVEDQLDNVPDTDPGEGDIIPLPDVTFERRNSSNASVSTNITLENPRLGVTITKPAGLVPKAIGARVYSHSGALLQHSEDDASSVDPNDTTIQCSCTLQDTTLTQISTRYVYSYEFYIMFDGVTYQSDRYSFQLEKPAEQPEPEPEPEPSDEPSEETTITLQIGNPRMTINGKRQNIDSLGTTPIARNNRTLLPVRAVIEGLGGSVGWDAANQIVPLTLDGKTLYLKLGSKTAWDSSGDYYALDSEPIALNNRTYLPIRFVVEYFGGEVGWEPDTQVITITKSC